MTSTPKKQRIIELDALRGMSLFGILLMNILVFSFPYEHVRLDVALQGVNGFLFRVVSLLVIDSFYPIFSFLFGFSLMLIYHSTQRRGVAFKPVMLRRLIFFGVARVTPRLFLLFRRYSIYICGDGLWCDVVRKSFCQKIKKCS